MTAAFILTGLRVAKESLGAVYEGTRIMHESTAYDMAVEEGEIRGRQHTLLEMGDARFGGARRSIRGRPKGHPGSQSPQADGAGHLYGQFVAGIAFHAVIFWDALGGVTRLHG